MWTFQPEFWGEFSDVNFGRWISWGWIFEVALFTGKHKAKKFDPRIRPQNSGLKKFASPNSGSNSGSRGAKSPLRKFAPEVHVPFSCLRIGKVPRRAKMTSQDGRVQIGKPPRSKPLCLAALGLGGPLEVRFASNFWVWLPRRDLKMFRSVPWVAAPLHS